MPSARHTPIEIGTSMLGVLFESARQADRKNGGTAEAAAGSAISADSQWKKSRCSGSMSETLPDHTGIDSIITFMVANAATPRQRSRKRDSATSATSALS